MFALLDSELGETDLVQHRDERVSTVSGTLSKVTLCSSFIARSRID